MQKYSIKVSSLLYLLRNKSIPWFQNITTAYNIPPKLYLTLSRDQAAGMQGHKLSSQLVGGSFLPVPPTVGDAVSAMAKA